MQEHTDEVVPDAKTPGLDDKVKHPCIDAFIAEIQRCTGVGPLDVPPAEIEGNDSYLEGYLIPKDATIMFEYEYNLLNVMNHCRS